MRRAAALLTAAVLVALIGALAPVGGTAAAATAHSVGISSYAFHPAVLTVTAGDTVTWTNSDQAPHDVTTTSAPVAIHGSRMEKGQSWSYTFTTAGTYAYICSIHPDMKATVIVKPAPAAPAPKTTAAATTPHLRYTTVAAGGGGMAMPASHRAKRHSSAPAHPSTTAAPTTPAPTTPAGTPVAVAAAAPAATNTSPERPLRPLLIVAGGVAALATLCLLLLAARPEGGEPPPR